MTPWIVMPVKSFARAKSRLDQLSPEQRATFAQRAFDHVIGAALQCDDIGGVAVVTNGDDVARRCRAREVSVLSDPPGAALGAVVDAALATLSGRGIDAALVVMADLPTIAARDIAAMIAELRAHDVVIAPDRHGRGTNALGLTPPARFATCFGHEDSFERHLARARVHDCSVAVYRSPGVGFDIDSPADYRELTTQVVSHQWR